MSDETAKPIDLSEVAAESPEESVEHEHEATDLIDEEARPLDEREADVEEI